MKRAWMLLLVMIALIAVMAVPAMAAETHEHGTCIMEATCADCSQFSHDEWAALPAGESSISATGNYYLSEDTVAANVTITGADTVVTICLNGKTWTGVGTSRPLTVTGGATVNIVDCSARTAYVSSGKINGVDLTVAGTVKTSGANYYGGSVYAESSTVNIYNGTISGGCAFRGGNVYLIGSKDARGALNLYGGVVTGTNSAKWKEKSDGTAISGYDEAAYASGGIAYSSGGNIYVDNYIDVTVGSAALQKTSAENCVPKISGGCNVYPESASKPNGGSIYIADLAQVWMHSGLVTGGACVNIGGNIYANGRLYISGGLITDGAAGGSKTSSSANISSVSGEIYMSGGQVDGCWSNTNTGSCVIDISGSAKILGTGISTVGYANYWKMAEPLNIHDLAEDAVITVNSCSGYGGPSYVASYDEVSRETLDAMVESGQLVTLSGSSFVWYDGGLGVHGNSEVWHCICGANQGEPHIGECGGYDVLWKQWALNGDRVMPNSLGYHYLVDADSNPGDGCVNVWRTNIDSVNGIYVDFNGVKVIQGTLVKSAYPYNERVRYANLYCSSTTIPTTIVYTDSSQNHVGGLIVISDGVKNAKGELDHSNIWLRPSATGCLPTTLSCYRLNVDCSEKTVSEGAGFAVGAGNFLNLYECHVIGGTAASKVGGAISNSGTTTVIGGSISGGHANTSGATIYNKGTMTLTDVEITGGDAVISGGAIYTTTGTLLATNCTILGGTAGKNGGAILHLSGTATYTNCDITAHTNEDESIVAQNGAAVYVDGGTMTLTGGSTVTGGLAQKGGAVYMAGGTFNLYDGTISGGTAAEGGNVYMTGTSTVFNAIPDPAGQAQGATRLIKEGHADATNAHAKGGNFCLYSGAKLTLTGATVSDGRSTTVSATFDTSNNKTHRYAYGGNIYAYTDAEIATKSEVILNGDTVVENGYAHGISHDNTVWTPGANIDMDTNSNLTVENATITGGQSLAEVDNSKVDGKNLYINYGCEVVLNSGAVISNTGKVNTQENIAIQGGDLTINDGASITTAEGVKGYNILFNASAYGNNPQHPRAPHVVMNGGTISGGNGASGGNVVLDYLGIFDMYGGVIENGVSGSSGGNVRLDHLSQFNMYGGTVRNGSAVNSGANIFIEPLATNAEFVSNHNEAIDPDDETEDLTAKDLAGKLYMAGEAQIYGGVNTNETITDKNGGSIFAGSNTSITLGGNAQIYGGTSVWCGGNIYTNGTITVGGSAKVYGGVAGSDVCNIFVVGGTLNLKDDAIVAGGISIAGTDPTVNLSGSPTVDKAWWTPDGYEVPDYSLRLTGSNMANIEGLSGARIYVKCGNVGEQTLREFTNAAADLDGAEAWLSQFHSDDEANVIGITNDYKLFMGNGPKGATVNGGEIYYELGAAAEKAAAGDFITMHSGYEGNVELKDNTWLDLNGQTLTGDITTTGLYLIDSANKAYEDKGGKVTGSIGTDPQRVFTTGSQDHYTGNHRFLVLNTEDGYSAHRIYLTVKSTVLYPNKPALNYRTVFKCDDTVAKYVTAYGVKVAAENYDPVHSDYLEKGIVLNTVEDNSYISQLNNLLTPDMSLDNQILYTETPLSTRAYITVEDGFGSGSEVLSAAVTKSFKDMVEYADGQTLSAVQQASLKDLYTKYEALMNREGEAWNLTNIAGFQSSEARGFQLRCMCNDPTGTGNPCAANGHKHFVWQRWTDFDATAPASGNYYLTADVTLAQPLEIPNGTMVSIDLCGHSLSVDAITVAEGGVLNLTNSADTGVTVAAVVTVNGNMSVYSGVNLGQVVGSGDMNLYGGTASKAEAFTGKWYPTDEE